MSYLLIKNGNVVANEKICKKDILIKDDKIVDASFNGEIPKDCKIIDANENYVSAGFIDIHLHGGGGYDFMDCTKEAFYGISKTHLENGTTLLVPTAVSSTFENILNLIKTYKECIDECPNFYGIHLEGPYISKEQKW